MIKLMKPARRTYLFVHKSLFSCTLPWVSPLQPVHNNGSSGYGSLGSNGSHEHYISVGSSSDSNGNLWEDSHREPVRQRCLIALSQADCLVDGAFKRAGSLFVYYRRWPCSRSVLTWTEWRDGASKFIWGQVTKSLSWENLREVMKPNTFKQSIKNVNVLRLIVISCSISQACVPPANSNPKVKDHEDNRKQAHVPSYQQINCVDNIIRCVAKASARRILTPIDRILCAF